MRFVPLSWGVRLAASRNESNPFFEAGASIAWVGQDRAIDDGWWQVPQDELDWLHGIDFGLGVQDLGRRPVEVVLRFAYSTMPGEDQWTSRPVGVSLLRATAGVAVGFGGRASDDRVAARDRGEAFIR